MKKTLFALFLSLALASFSTFAGITPPMIDSAARSAAAAAQVTATNAYNPAVTAANWPTFIVKNAAQTVTTGVNTKILLTDVVTDVTNAVDTTNRRFVAPVTGYYVIGGGVSCGASSSVTTCQAHIYKSGSLYRTYFVNTGGSTTVVGSFGEIIQLNATQYIELYGQNNCSGACSFRTGENYLTGTLVHQ